MDETSKKLESETEKWKKKVEEEMKNISPSSRKGKEFSENIRAYIKDSGYFLERGDYIRAFEAIIWAWALFETGKAEGILQ